LTKDGSTPIFMDYIFANTLKCLADIKKLQKASKQVNNLHNFRQEICKSPDSCSTLGVAQVSSMCEDNSCTVV